jgi:hypothetical protein
MKESHSVRSSRNRISAVVIFIGKKGVNVMESIPTGKQGDQFEPSPGVRAQWVTYAETFLFVPPPDEKLMIIALPEGKKCVGFSVADLAKSFGISPSDVMLNNQNADLNVKRETMTTAGAMHSTRYTFAIPFHGRVFVIVHGAPIAGSE